jgi:hypothetical protein
VADKRVDFVVKGFGNVAGDIVGIQRDLDVLENDSKDEAHQWRPLDLIIYENIATEKLSTLKLGKRTSTPCLLIEKKYGGRRKRASRERTECSSFSVE